MNIGILGAGQLTRMLALSGSAMGLRFRVVDPSDDIAEPLGWEHRQAQYQDSAAQAWLAEISDVVTFDFENVPADAVSSLSEHVPVRPGAAALHASQDRLREKQLLQELGIPVAPFRAVSSRQDLLRAIEELGLPIVLKTRHGGYDGKGQFVLRESGDAARAWEALGGRPLIAEAFVPFDRELSIIAARGEGGEMAFYPLAENRHESGILQVSRCRVGGAPTLQQRQLEAQSCAESLLSRLGYVGVLALEFFETQGGLIANEFAPRVHNSGHWTIEGCETSQFEMHLRAICGLPLGSTRPLEYAAMVNLIGELPPRGALLAVPGAHVHFYGKKPRRGRKVGHVTVLAQSEQELDARVEALLDVVQPRRRRSPDAAR